MCLTMSCFLQFVSDSVFLLQFVYNSVLFSSIVCDSVLLSAVHVLQCLFFCGLCVTVSSFLQVVFDIVLLSAVSV